MKSLDDLLQATITLHNHLCPRQVLGVRMGICAAELLNVPYPQTDKRLYTLVETDGCFADGVAVATGATLGHRTMRLMDFGKTAGTFIDTKTEHALRIRPRLDARQQAAMYVPNAQSRWHTQLEAYQIMPAEALFDIQPVQLKISIKALISRPGVRVNCFICGEEILNEREIHHEGVILCRACAGESYYCESIRSLEIMHNPLP